MLTGARIKIKWVCCIGAIISTPGVEKDRGGKRYDIAPVEELVKAGITVALGTDNIADIVNPFIDGDMWIEFRIMQEACRFYDIDEAVKIAATNGLKTLGLY